jgi:hypothetical protein
MGNRTPYLATCSIVSQPTMLSRAPRKNITELFLQSVHFKTHGHVEVPEPDLPLPIVLTSLKFGLLVLPRLICGVYVLKPSGSVHEGDSTATCWSLHYWAFVVRSIVCSRNEYPILMTMVYNTQNY